MCWVSGQQQQHIIGGDREKLKSSSLSLSTPSALPFTNFKYPLFISWTHRLSQKEECVCFCFGPLWFRDSMLNSILLQGLSPAYGHRTLRASWRHMPYRHKSLFFTCWSQNGSHTTAVKTYFLRTLPLVTLVGASITKNQEISVYKSQEV